MQLDPSGFYNSLNVIQSFSEVSKTQHYKDAPSNWWVLITDIKNSTKAIQQGQYKNVNQVGATVIAAVKNLLGNDHFLYVFGGDGATLVLSDQQYLQVSEKLQSLTEYAMTHFQLQLRVGSVQVKEILDLGGHIKVALLKINKHKNMAVFMGGGLIKADELIKCRDSPDTPSKNTNELSMDGLSCRWKPISSENGHILSLLVMSRSASDSAHIYTEVISALSDIFDGNLDTANPVHIHKSKYKGVFEILLEETRRQNQLFSIPYLLRCIEIVFCFLSFKLNIPLPYSREYIAAIPNHSDYKKIDDIIKMVLDCKAEQILAIEALLDKLFTQDKIYYGIHKSPQALMTCLVEGLSDGQHIHFIDGSDGGYTVAAEKMKKQIHQSK